MKNQLASLLVLCLVAEPDFAAAQSGRWGIIVNESTKACAQFWEGNACTKVTVPEKWKALLPEWNTASNRLELTLAGKTCALGASSAEECCKQFGYTFDKDFVAPREQTAKTMDPRSECFQLPEQKSDSGSKPVTLPPAPR